MIYAPIYDVQFCVFYRVFLKLVFGLLIVEPWRDVLSF